MKRRAATGATPPLPPGISRRCATTSGSAARRACVSPTGRCQTNYLLSICPCHTLLGDETKGMRVRDGVGVEGLLREGRSVPEVARASGLMANTLHKAIRAGRPPAVKKKIHNEQRMSPPKASGVRSTARR